MDDDQDPDTYFNEMAELREELEALGTTYNDNQILAVILVGLPEKYTGINMKPTRKMTSTSNGRGTPCGICITTARKQTTSLRTPRRVVLQP